MYWPLADWPRPWHDALRDLAVVAYEEKTASFGDTVRAKAGIGGQA